MIGCLKIGNMATILVLTEFEADEVKDKVESAAAFLQAVRALLSV